MKGLDRVMQIYVGDAYTAAPVAYGSLVYKFTTLADERQHADDLASNKSCRQGEGYIVVYDIETSEVLDKLECPL